MQHPPMLIAHPRKLLIASPVLTPLALLQDLRMCLVRRPEPSFTGKVFISTPRTPSPAVFFPGPFPRVCPVRG